MRSLFPGDKVRWRNESKFLHGDYGNVTGIIVAVLENEVSTNVDGIVQTRMLLRYVVVWDNVRVTITAEHALWQLECVECE